MSNKSDTGKLNLKIYSNDIKRNAYIYMNLNTYMNTYMNMNMYSYSYSYNILQKQARISLHETNHINTLLLPFSEHI